MSDNANLLDVKKDRKVGRFAHYLVGISAVVIYGVCMIHAAPVDKVQLSKPILPAWIMNGSASESLEQAAFASGSALALLHVALHDPITNTPTELLRNRLALRTAVNCLKIEGRMATEADIRDAFYLTALGDEMGPAGDMFALWRVGCGIRLGSIEWRTKLEEMLPEEMQEEASNSISEVLEDDGNPISRAVGLLTSMLKHFPRQEAMALMCADAILAHGLGWKKILPLFGLHMSGKVLRSASEGDDIRMDCHIAVSRAAQEAARLAHDLARRAGRLRAIAPKLRSKVSDEAITLFLSEDAVLPSTMLSPTIRGSNTAMTPRSARRLCERLIDLGVVKELTGRASFRLYGVA